MSIPQHNFSKKQLLQKLYDLGNRSSNATVLYHQAAAEKFGLNATDMKVIPLVTDSGEITAGTLAASLGLTTGAITNVIDRLEKIGLVKRVADPKDRRKVFVKIGPDGYRKAFEIYRPMSESLQELSKTYTTEQLAIIVDFTERTTAIMEQETLKLRSK